MRIEAFRGYRFGIDRGRNVSEVVAPPYDQISPEIQDRLYAMHPNNIVRVSYPGIRPGPARPPTSTDAPPRRFISGSASDAGRRMTGTRSIPTRRPIRSAAAR